MQVAKWVWIVGLSLTAAGEIWTAFDGADGGTISEAFNDAPGPLRAAILVAVGAVLGHWVWPMPTGEAVK